MGHAGEREHWLRTHEIRNGDIMEGVLRGKEIVLGVSGGIAAYKSVELLRLLKKNSAGVRVVMTANAREFVGPITFEALSERPVFLSMFDRAGEGRIRHIEWANKADAVVIAPATANIIGKLANGIADDPLTTFMLAVQSPVIICPAMNTNMYENRIFQRNLETLEQSGFMTVEPGSGELACGTTGPGRMAEPDQIVDRLKKVFHPKDFKGQKILVTAGPTREPLDPVRFITNRSSGKMGYEIARAAEYRGALVTLISGPANLEPPRGVKFIGTETAMEMEGAVNEVMEKSDIIIMVAAVADYRPEKTSSHKIKKKEGKLNLTLTRNPDILLGLGKQKQGRVLVGFAAETRDLDENAVKKMKKKNLDLLVGNLVGDPSSGFGTETNQASLYYPKKKKEELPSMSKSGLANIILDRVMSIEQNKKA